jgi:hypothetical protein
LGFALVATDTGPLTPSANGADATFTLTPPPSGTSRFQWQTALRREVTVTHESLNEVTIEVAPGPAGLLVRTDRYYPGWRVKEPSGLSTRRFGRWLLAVEVPPGSARITFAYTPRFLGVSLPVAALSLAGCLLAGLLPALRRRR